MHRHLLWPFRLTLWVFRLAARQEGLPWLPRHLVQFVHETKLEVFGGGELPLAEERIYLNHADEVHGLAVAQA